MEQFKCLAQSCSTPWMCYHWCWLQPQGGQITHTWSSERSVPVVSDEGQQCSLSSCRLPSHCSPNYRQFSLSASTTSSHVLPTNESLVITITSVAEYYITRQPTIFVRCVWASQTQTPKWLSFWDIQRQSCGQTYTNTDRQTHKHVDWQ